MPKVLISDKLSPQAIAIFKEAGVEADVKTGLAPDELAKIIGEYDGLAIRSMTKVTADLLKAATNLKVIGRAGIGVDNVDIAAATASGVVVMNTPFGNSITTAEHTISLMMALARQIPQANASTIAGKWEKNRFMGVELYSKVLGMIGCGNIGSIVADRAQGLKMKVVVYDPYLSEDRAKDLNVEKVELADLLKRADFITLHTPLTESTRGILNAERLAQCKRGVRIVNCARGGLIDETALKAALDSGQVAGAALDVFEEEPAKDSPLFAQENIVCTPHLGASTSEAQENVAVQVAEQMADFLINGTVTNAINMPSVSAEDAKKLKPYIALAGQLGSFAGQLTETGLKSVVIEYEGRVANLNTKPLTAVALKGLLSPLIDSVNMVNAPVIAKERNIEITESKRDTQVSNYQSLIRITVTTEKRSRTVAGTLFAGKPRIVELHGVRMEASMGPLMLYVHNEDKPGLVGGVGTLLGEAGVNIANFHLGRNEEHNDAVALIELDSDITKDQLEKFSQLPNVKQVKVLKF